MQLSKQKQNILLFLDRGYTVDKHGNVFSPKGRLRKGEPIKDGYIQVSFKHEKKVCACKVHQVQAYLKFGYEALTSECVRHLNGDPADNSWDNIAIGTHHDNAMDKSKDVRLKVAKHAASHRKSFSDEQIRNIRTAHSNGQGIRSLAREHGCAVSTMSYIINNKMYKDIF